VGFFLKNKFWIALAVPVLLAPAVYFLVVAKMEKANSSALAANKKIADKSSGLVKLGELPGEHWGPKITIAIAQTTVMANKREQELRTPPSAIGIGDILDWKLLVKRLHAARDQDTPAGAVVALLGPEALDAVVKAHQRIARAEVMGHYDEIIVEVVEKDAILSAINRHVITAPELYKGVPLPATEEGQEPSESSVLVQRIERAGAQMPTPLLERLNRLLFEQALPGMLASAEARVFFGGLWTSDEQSAGVWTGCFEERGYKAPLVPAIWADTRKAYERDLRLYCESQFFHVHADVLQWAALGDRVAERGPEPTPDSEGGPRPLTASDRRRRHLGQRLEERNFWIARYIIRSTAALNSEAVAGREDDETESGVDDFTVPVLVSLRLMASPDRILNFAHGDYFVPLGVEITVAMLDQRVPAFIAQLGGADAGFHITSFQMERYVTVRKDVTDAEPRRRTSIPGDVPAADPAVEAHRAAVRKLSRMLTQVTLRGYVLDSRDRPYPTLGTRTAARND
jgi:hypothetical protein